MNDTLYYIRYHLYRIRRALLPKKNERSRALIFEDMDTMSGYEFENIVADILRGNGYNNVRTTGASGDYGVDIIAERKDTVYAIQCKRLSLKVGITAVQEVHLGREYYGADVAVVVTNNEFTRQAVKAAEGKVILWDKKKLTDMLMSSKDLSFNRIRPSDSEIRMFIALCRRKRNDRRLESAIRMMLLPLGGDHNDLLRALVEHVYTKHRISDHFIKKTKQDIERDINSVNDFDKDLLCYHVTKKHLIGDIDPNSVINKTLKMRYY